jgi:phospholipid/cholesterol/gamma-HCH transport system substrate-binding protein/paraquat-inducible protein B
MAVDKSYARLGFFVVIALVVVLATAAFFIQRVRSRPLLRVVTYTTQNVSGLEIASPVRFRGVTVGRVSELRLDARGSVIEINFDLFLDRIQSLGHSAERVQQLADQGLVTQLRAQVLGNPVTGDAYLLLDMPKDPPPPLLTLDFTPDRPYVPMMLSPLGQVQDRLPEVMERAEVVLQTLNGIITRMPDSLDRSDRFFANVEQIFRESKLPELSADSRKFFSMTSEQIGQLSSNLERVIGPGGTLERMIEEAREANKAADLPATMLHRDRRVAWRHWMPVETARDGTGPRYRTNRNSLRNPPVPKRVSQAGTSSSSKLTHVRTSAGDYFTRHPTES